jgi:GWxTD domain-containing protein
MTDGRPDFNRVTSLNYLTRIFFVFFVLGMMGCGSSRKIALDPASRDFYETARLIMSKQEKDIFNHLPDQESREEFIRDFWIKRDPDPETEENEFKDEFFRRIAYANEHFKEGPPGWKTDRGRIYIYLGPPDRFEERPMLNYPDVKGVLIWIYYNEVAFQFIDRGDGRYALDPYSGIYGDFFGAIERAKLGYTREEDIFGNEFVDFDVEYDKEKQEIVVSLPTTSLVFIEEEGIFKADFEFVFYIYDKKGLRNDKFQKKRHFEMPEEEVLELEELIFTFPYELEPGKYDFDVVIKGGSESGKARKIFEINIK